MIELAPFAMLLLKGPNLLVETANPRLQEMLPGRDLVGSPLEFVFEGAGSEELVARVTDSYKYNVPRVTPRIQINIANEHEEKVERFFVFTIVPTHESGDKVDGGVLYAEDVTDQVNRETEERREKMKLMIEHADQVALGLYDAQTARLLEASPRYRDILSRMLGFGRDDLIGRTWQELSFVTSGKKALDLFKAVRDTRQPQRLPEVRVKSATDEPGSVWDLSLIPITYAGAGEQAENTRFMVVSAVEVTDQVAAREDLERLDRLKDVFLSLASHELRTPMVPLMGYADMITRLINRKDRENIPDWDKRVVDYASKFHAQLVLLNRLIDDLFDVARIESGKLTIDTKAVELAGIVEEALESARMMSRRHNFNFKMDQNSGPPIMVKADAQRMKQVLLNILQNSIKHAPNSKRVDVRLRTATQDAAENGSSEPKAKQEAILEVQDYGPGIPPEEVPKLFTRFYQLTREPGQQEGSGLGLGLFIARAIVEEHGGTITADSVQGKGSTFTIRLSVIDYKLQ